MTSMDIKRVIKGAALTAAMAMGIVLSASMSADAQTRRYPDRDRDRLPDIYDGGRYDRDTRGQNRRTQVAFDRGYRDGLRAGQRAARTYRTGYYGGYERNGYGSYGGYGNGRGNVEMRRAYELGYQRGYQEGYNRVRYQRNRNRSWWPF